jgi:hypothetical protein
MVSSSSGDGIYTIIATWGAHPSMLRLASQVKPIDYIRLAGYFLNLAGEILWTFVIKDSVSVAICSKSMTKNSNNETPFLLRVVP